MSDNPSDGPGTGPRLSLEPNLTAPQALAAVGAFLIVLSRQLETPATPSAPLGPGSWQPHLPGDPLPDEHREFLARLAQKKGKEGLKWTAAIVTAKTIPDGKELRAILSALPDPPPWTPARPNSNGHGHTPTRKEGDETARRGR